MILVVGSQGMLGQDLLALLGERGRGVDLPDIDITDMMSVQQVLIALKPSVVVNCAAYTDVDGCESDPETAMQVNAEGVAFLAMVTRDIGAKLVQIGTDYVFDGGKGSPYQVDDLQQPLNVYGESKLAGELNLAINPNNLLVRTQWLYGLHGKNFVETMLRLGKEKQELAVVNDQIGSPTWTVDLAKGIVALIDNDRCGIYHCANSGSTSWNGFAKAIFEEAGMSVQVNPMTTEQLNRPARRPLHSALDCSTFAADTGFMLQPWWEALKCYLAARPKEH
jgi:dTDP-4-dehydrorhamnose reductase